MKLHAVYQNLFAAYGPQGWWPLTGRRPGLRQSIAYHPGNFSYPQNSEQAFEICVGAILTQNTAWTNVSKALDNLRAASAMDPAFLARMPPSRLAKLIRPSGYFNQKAKRLRLFARAVLDAGGTSRFLDKATRESLLATHGIGPETADSILLYAAKRPSFVVDAYTKRILIRLGLVDEGSYSEIQQLFHRELPKETPLYNEFHALLVEHGKQHCRKIPICEGCPIRKGCAYGKTALSSRTKTRL